MRLDLLFGVAHGEGARDEALRDRGLVGGFDEVELGCRERGGVDAKGADDGVDVVFFKEGLERVDIGVVDLVSRRESLFLRAGCLIMRNQYRGVLTNFEVRVNTLRVRTTA